MTTPKTTRVGPALFLAAGLVGAQALAALGFGVFEMTQVQPQRPAVGVTAVITLLLYGGLLALVVRGLLRARRWSRGPAVATQILHLPIAWSFASGATGWIAALLAASSVVVLVCVLLPSSTRLLAREPESESSEPEEPDAVDDPDAADDGR
ncbi:MAG: hypothetical protein ACTH2Q_14805 [Propionibacteriaceae bacterium]